MQYNMAHQYEGMKARDLLAYAQFKFLEKNGARSSFTDFILLLLLLCSSVSASRPEIHLLRIEIALRQDRSEHAAQFHLDDEISIDSALPTGFLSLDLEQRTGRSDQSSAARIQSQSSGGPAHSALSDHRAFRFACADLPQFQRKQLHIKYEPSTGDY